MSAQLPSLTAAKDEAKRLRAALAENGRSISHSEALERLARKYGFRDWNIFHAAIRERAPDGWEEGALVRGRYLSQPFSAKVLEAERIRPGWFRLSLELDEPVDVVSFESFSNFRRRLRCVVGPAGELQEKTSDGEPHIRLEM